MLGGFFKRTERSDGAALGKFLNQSIVIAAIGKQFAGDVDGTLGGSDLEVCLDHIKCQILAGSADLLFFHQFAVFCLNGVEESQTEIQC